MNDKKQGFDQIAENQLSEKQMEEMDKMLAKRYGLKPPDHTNNEISSSTSSD